MAKIQANWIHGTAVQLEKEGYFISKARTGFGAVFRTHGGQWFHFAIPTPVIVDSTRSTLKKVFVLFKTEGSARITSLHLYDGAKKFASFDGLSLNGDHSQSLDPNNVWLPNPPHEMLFGLGLSLHVEFGNPTPGGVPGIWFMTAGADFETP